MTDEATTWWPTGVTAQQLGVESDFLMGLMTSGILRHKEHFIEGGLGGGFSWNLEACRRELNLLSPKD